MPPGLVSSLTAAADVVEAADQEAALVRCGCEQGQGQFFSVPIRATEIAGLFGSEATASLRLLAAPSYA
jgi:EAL domain-containing protein (putative c-di-GMP-specific phosphodiesterase class I)